MPKKIKIIFFANTLCYGGIEIALLNLLNSLDYNKYDITLCLEHKTGELVKEINKSINVIDYNLSSSKLIPLRKIINCVKRIRWSLKYKNKFDFSCCYATYSLLGNKLSLISSKNRTIYIHGNNANYMNEVEYKDFYDKRSISSFNKIIFVSNESKEDFLKYYPTLNRNCIVINNIVNYKKILEQSKEKIDYNVSKNDITFCFVGRLDEKTKRISLLLNTFKELINNNKNIKLLIVGDGEYMTETISFIENHNLKDNIILFGYKSNPYPYMVKSSYLVLTSITEGFPVVFLEAITLNKPIISTIDITDNNISINKIGYIVDDKNIFKNIEDILKNKPISTSLKIEEINASNLKLIEDVINNEI